MRKWTLSTCILFRIVLLIAGGNKDKKEGEPIQDEKKTEQTTDSGPATKLEGDWEIRRAVGSSGSIDSMNIGTVYSFKGSKLSFGKDGFVNPGTTVVTD